MYHRKDGLVVKERDDLISSSRYALMMLRHAKPATWKRNGGMPVIAPHSFNPLEAEAR